ncbi:hypothetical protein [Deinococcus sp. Marseille-Q6407]|uniref:hypothetical protein n=1 Tax=Deinococcus sp. Marseille-Q6407 TaxID=2969223 RepID=UPI0021C04730|nr:hypothetical protein [Deinococcus sp. Marseille-Q6407]
MNRSPDLPFTALFGGLGAFCALRTASDLILLPYPLALAAWLLGVAALVWGALRQQRAGLVLGWLGLTLLSGVLGGYVADELGRAGNAFPELLSLLLGLLGWTALALRPAKLAARRP